MLIIGDVVIVKGKIYKINTLFSPNNCCYL